MTEQGKPSPGWWIATQKADPSTAIIVEVCRDGDVLEVGYDSWLYHTHYNFIRKLDLEELASGKS